MALCLSRVNQKKIRCWYFVATLVYLLTHIIVTLSQHSCPKCWVSKYSLDAKTEISMIWNCCQICRWIAKAKSVGICTVVKASLIRDQRLTIQNFTILGHSLTHPPRQFWTHWWGYLEFLVTLLNPIWNQIKAYFSQTDRWQNNHGLLTSKRCANTPLVILLQIWETREKTERTELIWHVALPQRKK